MATPASILVYGRDSHLIETRRMLLQNAGFQVSTTLRFSDFEETAKAKDVDLFILCHTLSAEECEIALAASQQLQPGKKNLLLTATTGNCTGGSEVGVLSVFEGPRALLATVDEMLTGSKGPSPRV